MIDVSYDASDLLAELDNLEDKLGDLPLDQIGELMLEDVRSKTPVDTGFLRDSNDYDIVGATAVEVSNDADYAGYVNDGTRYMSAQPFMFIDFTVEQQIEDLLLRHVGE